MCNLYNSQLPLVIYLVMNLSQGWTGEIIWDPGPKYCWVGAAVVGNVIHTFLNWLILKYLASKSEGDRTTMDVANKFVVVSSINLGCCFTLQRSVDMLTEDTGEVMALIMAWVTYNAVLCFFMGLLSNVVIQAILVSLATGMESTKLEFLVRILLWIGIPLLNTSMYVARSRTYFFPLLKE